MPVKDSGAGERVSSGSATLYTGSGRVIGIMVSHAEATTQTVTIYDNTAASGTILAVIKVHPYQSPVYIRFGETRELWLYFATGLTVDAGAHCDVNVWWLGY